MIRSSSLEGFTVLLLNPIKPGFEKFRECWAFPVPPSFVVLWTWPIFEGGGGVGGVGGTTVHQSLILWRHFTLPPDPTASVCYGCICRAIGVKMSAHQSVLSHTASPVWGPSACILRVILCWSLLRLSNILHFFFSSWLQNSRSILKDFVYMAFSCHMGGHTLNFKQGACCVSCHSPLPAH